MYEKWDKEFQSINPYKYKLPNSHPPFCMYEFLRLRKK